MACRAGVPVADEFVATIEVQQAGSYPDRPPVLVTYMHGGVGYEPLRRLAPLLGMFGLDVQSVVVWPEAVAEDNDDEDEENDIDENEDEHDDEEPWEYRELRTLADADRLAAELAEAALERAVPYAKRYATFDALLERVAWNRTVSVRYAALLAAAGRFEEAKASLPGPWGPGGARRAARRPSA